MTASTADTGDLGFDSARHVPLGVATWDPGEAEAAIVEVVEDTVAHLRPDALWPVHRQDDEYWEDGATLYLGGAGVVWALHLLGQPSEGLDLRSILHRVWDAHCPEAERFGPYGKLPSYLMGDVGLLALELRLDGASDAADRLHARVEEALRLPVLELMWGLPGAMLACLFAHDLTGEERWRDLFRRAAAVLLADLRDTEWGRIWVQDLYGTRAIFLGAVHGYAGNMAPLLRGWAWLDESQRDQVAGSIVPVLPATARRDASGANWPSIAGQPSPPRLVQHCHGAPGMVTTFAAGPVRSPELDTLLREAGELIWRTGPLAKGSNLCHGTAGNGLALLRLWRHTGEQVWLDRARAFAMAAIQQCREARRLVGSGRFTLWTGDLGLALYLKACAAGHAAFPTVDAWPGDGHIGSRQDGAAKAADPARPGLESARRP